MRLVSVVQKPVRVGENHNVNLNNAMEST